MRRHPDPEPKGGPPAPAGEVLQTGRDQPARDPQRVYCRACGADISRCCSWLTLPLGPVAAAVLVIPLVCPECNHVLRPRPSPIARPGRIT